MPRPDDELSCAWSDHDYADGAQAALIALSDMIKPETDEQRLFYERFRLLMAQRREAALRVIMTSYFKTST